MLYSIFHVDC